LVLCPFSLIATPFIELLLPLILLLDILPNKKPVTSVRYVLEPKGGGRESYKEYKVFKKTFCRCTYILSFEMRQHPFNL
jgi:hypothetical protein